MKINVRVIEPSSKIFLSVRGGVVFQADNMQNMPLVGKTLLLCKCWLIFAYYHPIISSGIGTELTFSLWI